MATQAEKLTVNAAGLVQGIALVTFPAASEIFTAADKYHLSNTQYGTLFVPQVITAVSTSLLGAALAGHFGNKRVYLAGLAANLVSMLLLIASWFVVRDQSIAFPLLLVSTACLGVGFGLAVPALNTMTAAFAPEAVDRAVLVLNALLGLGTALAPVFVAIFVGLGIWVGLPLLVAFLLLILIVEGLGLPLQVEPQALPGQAPGRPVTTTRQRASVPVQFWVFAGFALLYGFCETVSGNWAQRDITVHLGLTATVASLALTAFWAVVTAGRMLFAAIARWFPTRLTYHVLPFVLAVALLLIAALPQDMPLRTILAFALAGLGCSALVPLTISFGQQALPAVSGAVAGWLLACYLAGYGVAAFGVGSLRDAGVTFPAIFTASAGVAVVLGALSFVVTHQLPVPADVDRRQPPSGEVATS
jgi:MFS family permease